MNSSQKRGVPLISVMNDGRGDWTRTSDLVVPNDARYRLRHTPMIICQLCHNVALGVATVVATMVVSIIIGGDDHDGGDHR